MVKYVVGCLAVFVLVTLTSFSRFALAKAPTCDCGFGTVNSTSPACVCECGTYLQPACKYRAADTVTIDVWMTIPFSKVSQDLLVPGIQSALQKAPVNMPATLTATIEFVALSKSTSQEATRSVVKLKMLGIVAAYLKQQVKSQAAWAKLLSIESTFDHVNPPPDDTRVLALIRDVVVYSDGMVTVYVDDIGWLIGAIAVVFAVPFIERMLFHNKEENVNDSSYEEASPHPEHGAAAGDAKPAHTPKEI